MNRFCFVTIVSCLALSVGTQTADAQSTNNLPTGAEGASAADVAALIATVQDTNTLRSKKNGLVVFAQVWSNSSESSGATGSTGSTGSTTGTN